MKKLSRFLFLPAIALLALSSCKKNTVTQPATPIATMSFKVDGVEHDMTNVFAVYHSSGGAIILMISGTYQNEDLNIQLYTVSPYTITTGVFPSNSLAVYPEYNASIAPSDYYLGTSLTSILNPGVTPIVTVNITNLSASNIEGTFAFNAANNNSVIKNITEGKFNCLITNQ